MLEILKVLNDKKREYRRLIIFNLLLTFFLTLIGSISIISLSMFLYKEKIFSFLGCIFLDLILGSVYSFFSNIVLEKNADKKKKLLCEISEIEYNLNKILNSKNKSINLRYDNLSRDSKLKLLSYIKDNLSEFNIDNIDNLIEDNDLIIDDSKNIEIDYDNRNLMVDKGSYSRKKKK